MFNKMYDIITFGSAAQDIFVKSKAFKILKGDNDFATGEGICLPFGSKIDVEDIFYATGGGGTNVAAAFAKQGFKTAFCGAIGIDMSGLEIVRELKFFKVNTNFIVKKKEKHTNHSVVISSADGDRTILVYRGASDILNEKDIQWKKIKKAKWFYLAPLASPTASSRSETSSSQRPKPEGEGGISLFEKIVNFAHENKIKIAVNPSKQQLSLPAEELKRIFCKADILFLNQEEASLLTKIPFEDEAEIFKKLDEIVCGICVMTKGGEGVVASDGSGAI